MSTSRTTRRAPIAPLRGAWGAWGGPLTLVTAFALLAAACSAKASGPPEILVDRTACSHCGMLISEPVYAAAYQAHEQEPRVFDDIGCMLESLGRHTTSPATVWVQDVSGKGWLPGSEAIFVASPHLRTPMGGGILAYADAAAADEAATAHQGEVVRSFQRLMTRRGDPE
jgi:copper chaperone NosL